MFVPSARFLAVIHFWIWRFLCHRVYIAPATAAAREVCLLFPLGSLLRRNVSLFHLETPPKDSIARHRENVMLQFISSILEFSAVAKLPCASADTDLKM